MDVKVAALIWAEMVSAGVVPLTQEMFLTAKQSDIDKLLVGLPEEDRRALKRKFRKLWRKARFKKGRRMTHVNRLREGEPNTSQMRRRKENVFRHFYLKAIDIIKKSDPGFGQEPW